MSHRVARVAELIRAEVSDLLLHKLRDPRIQGLVTVTEVEVSGDLRQARVFVSVLGSDAERAGALAGLRSAQGFMRREVGRRARLRVTPELLFTLDDSIARGARMLALMKDLGLGEEPAAPDAEAPPALEPDASGPAAQAPAEGSAAEERPSDSAAGHPPRPGEGRS